MILRYLLFAAALNATPVQPPPLFDNLDTHQHPISTNVPGAQRYFDQRLRLLYAFNHDEALRDFQEAVRRDPQCLICLWGVALSLGPHINVARDAEKEKLAWETIQRAKRPEAEAMYREDLRRNPENGWALFGLMKSLDGRSQEEPRRKRASGTRGREPT
jgi:tetratricopeptide (TPR) repeat protein